MQNNLTYVRQVQIDPKSLQLMVKESGSREPSYLDSRRGLMKVARENSFMPNVFDSGRLAPIFTDLHRSSPIFTDLHRVWPSLYAVTAS